MNKMEIKKNILEVLVHIAPEVKELILDNKFEDEEPLRDQVDLDSMDYLNFMTQISEIFKTHIPENDYSKISSLKDFVAYLEYHDKESSVSKESMLF